ADEPCGVYRLHGDGQFSRMTDAERRDSIEAFYQHMVRVLEPSRAVLARWGCSRYFFDCARAHFVAGDLVSARDCFLRSLRRGVIGSSVPNSVLTGRPARLGLSLLRRSLSPTSAR